MHEIVERLREPGISPAPGAEKRQARKTSELESVRLGKPPEPKSVRPGKRQNWKASGLERTADMKLKIAICDDEASQRAQLFDLVSAWAKRNRYLAEAKQYEDADSFFFDYEEEKDFDILLLDIEMPGKNGIELAKRVRRENSAVQIVFITGYYEYFSDGYDVSALHYLLKPVNGQKLCSVLDKAAENLAYRQRSVLLSTAEGEVRVPLSDIMYVESENVHIVVHTVRGEYRSRMALARFAEQLDDTFFKVHRSYIAALKYIKKVTRTQVTMTNGDALPISRGLYDGVHEALIRYL